MRWPTRPAAHGHHHARLCLGSVQEPCDASMTCVAHLEVSGGTVTRILRQQGKSQCTLTCTDAPIR